MRQYLKSSKIRSVFLWVCVSLIAQLVKNPPAMQETPVQSPGEGKGYQLQCSGLENSMDCIVHGIAKSQDTTERLSLSVVVLPPLII